MSFFSLLGAVEIGLIFSLVALGVFISFRLLRFPDLTVDGSFPLGGAVCAILISTGTNAWLATLAATAAGAVLRTLHRYDSGVLTGSPVQAAITLGQQTSIKTWRQVQWDTGVTDWAAEDLLAVSTSTARRPASPVFDGSPDRAFHIGRSPVFRWTVGGNTVEHRLYVSTTATPGASDLKWTGFSDSWQANYNLAWGTRHWWRVDSRGYNGVWAPGPVYSFCTELPPPGYVIIQGVDAQPPEEVAVVRHPPGRMQGQAARLLQLQRLPALARQPLALSDGLAGPAQAGLFGEKRAQMALRRQQVLLQGGASATVEGRMTRKHLSGRS